MEPMIDATPDDYEIWRCYLCDLWHKKEVDICPNCGIVTRDRVVEKERETP